MMKDICMLWAEPSQEVLFGDNFYVDRREIVRIIGMRSRQAQFVLNDILLRRWQKGENLDEDEIAKIISDCSFDIEKMTVSFNYSSFKYELPLCYWLKNA